MATRAAKTEKGAVDPAQPFKRRARRRLLGALVFAVLIASILPMLLDPEPTFDRPALHLDIPSRDTRLPVPAPAPEAATVLPSQDGVAATAPAPAPLTQASKPATPSPPATTRPGAGSTGASASSGQSSSVPAPAPKEKVSAAPPAPVARPPTEAPRPAPPVPAASVSSRWLVQVGLFGRPENASALVARIRSLGLPVYTESVQPGARTRVRVGPFPTRAEAERARARLTLNNIEATLVSP